MVMVQTLEAQEDEALLPSAEAGDPGLVGVQSQPERFQDHLDPGLGRLGPDHVGASTRKSSQYLTSIPIPRPPRLHASSNTWC